jgi:hypothetical protein
MRRRTSLSQAKGSTLLSFAVAVREQMVGHGTPPVRACERVVLAPQRDGPDGTLDRIVVEFDAAIIEESGEVWPARERITDGLGEGPAGERGQAPSRARASSSR